MDFSLTEEQQAFQDSAREFARREFAPSAARWDEEHIFPVESIRRAGDLGFCGLYAPESCGGLGVDRLSSALVFEELAAGCTSTTAYLTIHNMVAWMLGTFAQPDIAAAWGPELTSGRKLGSYCLTEPDAGSDAASLRTRAERQGDHYLLNGSKAFISGAGCTDLLIVMARTGGPGASGISAFAVPADLPGIRFGRPERKMGWNSQPTAVIVFDDVRVPTNHLLGVEGGGFTLAMKGLDGGRINIATCSIGTAQAALDAALRHVGGAATVPSVSGRVPVGAVPPGRHGHGPGGCAADGAPGRVEARCPEHRCNRVLRDGQAPGHGHRLSRHE